MSSGLSTSGARPKLSRAVWPAWALSMTLKWSSTWVDAGKGLPSLVAGSKRREGLALLGGGLEAPGFDRVDGHLIEAESGAADDLDILRRAVFVYHQAHDNGGIHARAAGLFAILRFGSGDDARRAGGPGLGKQESGCEGGDEAGCLGHVPSGGAAGGSWRTRADLEVCPTLSR